MIPQGLTGDSLLPAWPSFQGCSYTHLLPRSPSFPRFRCPSRCRPDIPALLPLLQRVLSVSPLSFSLGTFLFYRRRFFVPLLSSKPLLFHKAHTWWFASSSQLSPAQCFRFPFLVFFLFVFFSNALEFIGSSRGSADPSFCRSFLRPVFPPPRFNFLSSLSSVLRFPCRPFPSAPFHPLSRCGDTLTCSPPARSVACLLVFPFLVGFSTLFLTGPSIRFACYSTGTSPCIGYFSFLRSFFRAA